MVKKNGIIYTNIWIIIDSKIYQLTKQIDEWCLEPQLLLYYLLRDDHFIKVLCIGFMIMRETHPCRKLKSSE